MKKSDYHSVNDQIPLQQLQKFIGLGYNATLTIQKQPLKVTMAKNQEYQSNA